jgi:hypothetical protein
LWRRRIKHQKFKSATIVVGDVPGNFALPFLPPHKASSNFKPTTMIIGN